MALLTPVANGDVEEPVRAVLLDPQEPYALATIACCP